MADGTNTEAQSLTQEIAANQDQNKYGPFADKNQKQGADTAMNQAVDNARRVQANPPAPTQGAITEMRTEVAKRTNPITRIINKFTGNSSVVPGENPNKSQ